MRIQRLFFPDPPRDLPGHRMLKISLRAAHVLCVALFVGAFFFELPPATLSPWYSATLATGILLLLLDLYESAVFLLQVRGLLVVAKISCLALLPAFGDAAGGLLLVLLLVSVLSSHAPSRVRYFMLWGRGRLRSSDSRG